MSFSIWATLFMLISCTKLISIKATNYESSIASTTLTTEGAMSMELVISDSDDMVTLTVTGPVTLYYSIGIGSCYMVDSWSVVMLGEDEDDTTPFEQLLGKDSAGTTLTSTFDVTEDTTSGLLRTVVLERAISTVVDEDSYYSFTTDDESIEVMWAYGTGSAYENHGSDQRGCTELTFSKTEEVSSKIFNWQKLLSNDSSYLFGQSPVSLIAVMILLSVVMVYAVYRYCMNTGNANKLNKRLY
eukprot:1847_1